MTPESELPVNPNDLLERIQSAWNSLQQTIASASPAELERAGSEGWSVKDHIAHLTAWERWMLLYHLQGISSHKALQVPEEMELEKMGTDKINALLQERSRKKTLSEVRDEAWRTHAQVLATLTKMPFEDLLKQHYPDDPEARPVLLWVIGNTYDHYQEHRQYILDLLR